VGPAREGELPVPKGGEVDPGGDGGSELRRAGGRGPSKDGDHGDSEEPSVRVRRAGASLRGAAWPCPVEAGESCRAGRSSPCSEEQGLLDLGGPGGWGSEESLRPGPGEGETGLRRAPGPSPEEAGPTIRRTPGSRHHGGGPPRSGREVLGGSRCPGGAPKSSVGRRGGPGVTPEGWDGVRGRDSDAVMLRSACADPHITGHAAPVGASSNGVAR
jgi:hypothetical protein